jgi:hypothetical protein
MSSFMHTDASSSARPEVDYALYNVDHFNATQTTPPGTKHSRMCTCVRVICERAFDVQFELQGRDEIACERVWVRAGGGGPNFVLDSVLEEFPVTKPRCAGVRVFVLARAYLCVTPSMYTIKHTSSRSRAPTYMQYTKKHTHTQSCTHPFTLPKHTRTHTQTFAHVHICKYMRTHNHPKQCISSEHARAKVEFCDWRIFALAWRGNIDVRACL